MSVNRPCPTHENGCSCINDNPFANLSSEAPDPPDVIRMGYVFTNPPINAPETSWDIPFPVGSASGTDPVRVQDAAVIDANAEGFPPPIYLNSERFCSVPCPGGTSFSYTLPAGSISAQSQVVADFLAQSVCEYRAEQARACAPVVFTSAASNIAATSATLNGTVNPNGSDTTYHFEWGTTAAYGNVTPVTSVGSGSASFLATANIVGLPSGTIHFRIVGISAQGTSYGADKTFSTATITIAVVQDIYIGWDLSDDGIIAGQTAATLPAYWKSGSSTILPGFGAATGVLQTARNNRVAGSADTFFTTDGLWDVVGAAAINIGSDLIVYALNDSGVAAVNGTGANIGIAYRYTPGVGLLDLGNIGLDSGIGRAGTAGANSPWNSRTINNAGQIAVTSRNAVPTFKACRWSGGVLTNISPAFCPVGNASSSVAINASGNILGGYILAGLTRCFFWNGVAVDFGVGGSNTYPYALNDVNQVCGSYGGAFTHAFRWNSTDGLVAIAELPGTIYSEAMSLNNAGWIVGYMATAFVSVAFIHKDGVVTALHDLLPVTTDWNSLEIAYFVNNNKQIAGYGTYLGTPGTWFLMTLP